MIKHWVTRKRTKLVATVEIALGDLIGYLETPESKQEIIRKLEDALRGLKNDIIDVGHILQREGETGTVKWFNEEKGFGFITTRDSKDIFVHHRGIAGDESFKTLRQGDVVRFKRRQGKTSFEAYDVTPDE